MMKRILILGFFLFPALAFSQQPKLYLKAFGGINSTTFVYRSDSINSDYLIGWQAGAGMRVSKRQAFAEFNITYVNYGVTWQTPPDFDPKLAVELRVHTLEIPINIGYIPVKTPVFKWYLYGGLVNKFSLRGKIYVNDEVIKYKPSELNLHVYGLAARFGTQIDLAMFNFDFSYTIGVTNGFKGRIRTNTHALQLTAGFIF
jgi:hypothetical protein